MAKKATVTEVVTGADLATWRLSAYPANTKLQPEVVASVLASLANGNYISTACAAAGITERTFRNWRDKAESDDPAAQPYREFLDLCNEARALGETENVATIKAAAATNWTAAAWLLERQYPERWGRRDAVHQTGDVQHRVVFELVGQKRLGASDDDGEDDQG